MGPNRKVFLIASVLTTAAVAIGLLRFAAVGNECHFSPGQGNFRVTLLVRGQADSDPRLITACPLDMGTQHVYGETFASEEFTAKVMENRNGERRQVQWSPRLGNGAGAFEVRYQFHCNTDVSRPNASMKRIQQHLNSSPRPGQSLHSDPGIDPEAKEIDTLALDQGEGLQGVELVRSLFRYVHDHVEKEPMTAGTPRTASECLGRGRGNSVEQSRLLTALLRNRGIPARLVHGLILKKTTDPSPHTWVEAWAENHWIPLCPYHNHFGKVPHTFLLFGHGDMVLVRPQNVKNLEQGFLVEHLPTQEARLETSGSALARFFHRLSLYNLPPAEFRLVEFLLQLPLAALIICLFRNIVGMQTFGTFTPALLGLAFRELESIPGMLVFVSVLLVGWSLRRILDRFHLLQVPRTSIMLSLIVILLIGLIVAANEREIAATRFLSLFPLVILTGMIERFWTLESEDGTLASFRTLFNTLAMAGVIALTLSWTGLVSLLVAYPEGLGILLAGQLLVGRYTGYRLTEIWRFKDLLEEPETRKDYPSSRAA